MISRLTGTLIEKKPPQLVLDVGGVGYELEAPMTTFYRLPELGEQVVVFTHLVVREDAHLLFAFGHATERALFRKLIRVNGVGPKLALAILSNFEPDAFVAKILEEDCDGLTRIPGVGKKTAERLLIELRQYCKDWVLPETLTAASMPYSVKRDIAHDAIDALVALGYKFQQATKTVEKIKQEADSSESLIRLALQAMS